MTRAEALERLRAHETELRAMGASALYLFGSTARDEARADSDVDVFYEEEPTRRLDLLEVVGVGLRLGELMGRKVDAIPRTGLHPRLRSAIEADAVRVY